MWLVHDYLSHDVEIAESAKLEKLGIPVQGVSLNKRYNMFVIDKNNVERFVEKIKEEFSCGFKIYEFSENEMLVGEHYIDPSKHKSIFIPWLLPETPVPEKNKVYSDFFLADFNATFELNHKILKKYLSGCQCVFNLLECFRVEPAFYTGDYYYSAKLKVQMPYADVLLVMGLLFKMIVENHRIEDEGSISIVYGRFVDDGVTVFDRWNIANIWTLNHDTALGREMPLFCNWEFEQVFRKYSET